MIQWIIFTDERAGRPRASKRRSRLDLAAFPPGSPDGATGNAVRGVPKGGRKSPFRSLFTP